MSSQDMRFGQNLQFVDAKYGIHGMPFAVTIFKVDQQHAAFFAKSGYLSKAPTTVNAICAFLHRIKYFTRVSEIGIRLDYTINMFCFHVV